MLKKLVYLSSIVHCILVMQTDEIDPSLGSKDCKPECKMCKDDCISECTSGARECNKMCSKIKDRTVRENCVRDCRNGFKDCCDDCHFDFEDCIDECDYSEPKSYPTMIKNLPP